MKIRDAQLDTVCGYTSKLPDSDLPEIAFAGRSNVGKSSLINSLMQRKRLARVGETPGKTRTVNYYQVDALITLPASGQGPLPETGRPADGTSLRNAAAQSETERAVVFHLVDLPGYGYASVSLEEKARWGKMVERYLRTSQNLQAVFLLVDIRHAPNANDRQMYEWVTQSGYQPIIIATKADKLKRSQLARQIRLIREGLGASKDRPVIAFSAQTGSGREEIAEKIEQILCMK